MCLYVDMEDQELGDLNEPANYKAALLDPESDKWLAAMNVEMQSMKDNQTNMEGNVHTYKARLVVKGFTQTYGVDYEETFSLVADIRAIRILIAIADFYDYKIWQIDVKTAFLNGHLSEEVYMVQPEEAEYIAALDASKEVVWIRKFICGLGVVPINEEPMKMYYDNTGAITIANEPGITKGARHYLAKVYYLLEVIEFGDIVLEKFTQMTM
ncbi:putative retrotransposon ty1-copia subclass protein [Tanacetum coccineum]